MTLCSDACHEPLRTASGPMSRESAAQGFPEFP